MLVIRRFLCLALPLALCLALASIGYAQDASADQAKVALQKGEQQYKALDFKGAKATLLSVKRDALADADKKVLDDYLGRIDTSIRKQASAMEAFDSAEAALKSNDLAKAEQGYSTAAASDFLPPEMRKSAQAQLALVKEKQKAAPAATSAAGTKPAPASGAAPVKPVATAASTKPPVVAEAPPAKPTASAPAATTKPDLAGQAALAELEQKRAQAAQLVAQGKKAMSDGKFEEAGADFERALNLDPNNADAQAQLKAARSASSAGADTTAFGELATNRAVAKGAADLQFDQAIKQANETLARAKDAASFESAAGDANTALSVLEVNKGLYSVDEYGRKKTEAEELRKTVQAKQDRWQRVTAMELAKAAGTAEEVRRIKMEQDRQKRIGDLVARSKQLQSEQKYRESLDTLEQIFKIDPNNSWANDRYDLLQQTVLLQQTRQPLGEMPEMSEGDAQKTQMIEEQKTYIDIRLSEIPWYQLMRYPNDWKELTARRLPYASGSSGESPANAQVRQKLRTRVIAKLDFDGIEFGEVINFLRDVSGLNFFVKWTALETAGIQSKKPVTVHLSDVTVEKALNVILDDVGGSTARLGYVIDDGVITISTRDDLAQKTVTQVYDISDLIFRVPNFVGPRIDVTASSNTGSGGNNGSSGGGSVFGNNTSNTGNTGEDQTPTKQQMITQITTLIAKTIDPESWRAPLGTGAVGDIQELRGQLVVTQTAENQKNISDLINKLRESRALQIAIEARFITVQNGFLNSIGLDFDFQFNLGSKLQPTFVTDPWTGAQVFAKPGSAWGPGFPGNSNVSPLGWVQNGAMFVQPGQMTTGKGADIGTLVGANGPAFESTIGILDDVQAMIFIQATQANTSSRVLTAPRVTIFNGQRAYVSVAEQIGYVSGLNPVVADNVTTFQPIVSWAPSGSVLDVEGTVSADKRYVTMTVRPQVSLVKSFRTFAITRTSSDPNAPVTGSGFLELLDIVVQEVQTTVSVPDGGTLLLGGQKISSEVEREIGVPVLNKIPIVNRLFDNRAKVRDEETLLIMIKPKIIIQREEEEKYFGS